MWTKKEKARLPLGHGRSGRELHNFVRGNDRVPGAWISVRGVAVTLLGSTQRGAAAAVATSGVPVTTDDGHTVHVVGVGLVLTGSDGDAALVTKVALPDGRTIDASALLSALPPVAE